MPLLPLNYDNQKCPQMSPGGEKSPLAEKLLFRKVLLTEVCGMDRRHMGSEQGDPLEG